MIIKNGIVADPASGLYEHMDILVKDGKIVKIAPDISCASDAAATEKEISSTYSCCSYGTWHDCLWKQEREQNIY